MINCVTRCHGCQYRNQDDRFYTGPGLWCRAKLPHVEPNEGCALDELNIWLMEEAPEMEPDEQRAWLIQWSNRRSADVIRILIEPVAEMINLANDDVTSYPEQVKMCLSVIGETGKRALRKVGVDPERAIRWLTDR